GSTSSSVTVTKNDPQVISYLSAINSGMNSSNSAWVLLGQVWDRDIKPYMPYLKNIGSGGSTSSSVTVTKNDPQVISYLSAINSGMNSSNSAWVLLGQVWDRDIKPYMPILGDIRTWTYNTANGLLYYGQTLWGQEQSLRSRITNNLWDIDRRMGGYGYAEGGISTGPSSGHWELLHGTEAVIPLKSGGIPVVITGGQDDGGLKSELAALRREMTDLGYSIAKQSIITARIVEKWDYDGMPAVRA
ncbi:MAG: hypothetical protein M0022_10625, partial [Desulfobacteraceae bacterium]|nr:hypothetical protein [Desulfobacteraceae bacterium]